MNLEKVVFAFFSILALTLNFGFFIGELDDPAHHNAYELFAALVVIGPLVRGQAEQAAPRQAWSLNDIPQ